MPMRRLFILLSTAMCFVGFLSLLGCSDRRATVFINGDILTMDETRPSVEAIAINDGKIIAVGEAEKVQALAGSNAIIRDLYGKTLIPGFIDAHGHFGLGAFMATMADLQPPPAGGVASLDDLTSVLRRWHSENPKAPWILGFGYDDSLLGEGRHPTRHDLDLISKDIPIMVLHVSAHLLACNSACLNIAGISATTEDPAGGIIRRVSDGRDPTGILEETAMQAVISQLPKPSAFQAINALKAHQRFYASHGITTAQEGAATPEILRVLQVMALLRQWKIDLAAYPVVRSVNDFDTDLKVSKQYKNRFRLGGIKLILDGSPQGKTAWLTKPYHVVPEGLPPTYVGYPTMTPADVNEILGLAFENDIQVLAHANGDAAADQLLSGVAHAENQTGRDDQRTIMIHAQTVRDDQISRMNAASIIPSYFAAHTFYWGDWHRDSVLGPMRASRISPLQSTLSAGIPLTIHNDAPVVPPDMPRLVWSAVNRETRSGQTLGADEQITPLDALRAITINAAYQYYEEDTKGSLEVGKIADLVILSDNPTTIDPARIKDIRILETLKEGRSIFLAE